MTIGKRWHGARQASTGSRALPVVGARLAFYPGGQTHTVRYVAQPSPSKQRECNGGRERGSERQCHHHGDAGGRQRRPAAEGGVCALAICVLQ